MNLEMFIQVYGMTITFVLGACIGSFLNVVIYRLPAGKSVISPRSQCRCGAFIKWYDNIPIFSWILLRGKCRACGERFSIRYSLIELGTALLFLAFYLKYPLAEAVVFMTFASLMIPAAFIDLDTMEIPDRFSIGGFVLGVIISFAFPAIHGFEHTIHLVSALQAVSESLKGAFIGSGLILWIALLAEAVLRKEAMGFGDVKLMGAIGAFCGWQGAVFSLFGGALLGTLAIILCWPFVRKNRDAEDGGIRIPFGPALIAGAFLYLLLCKEPVDAYFNELNYLLTANP